MFSAAATLERLKSGLGNNARLLQHAPLSKVETVPLHDDAAVSFRILFGNIREVPFRRCGSQNMHILTAKNATDKMRTVYIHLYPATTPTQHSEIQFHSYGPLGEYQGKEDGHSLSQRLSECAVAFKLSGRSTKGKIIALARYYFLERLAALEDPADNLKLKFGISISKTFKDDLITACRELEEGTKKTSSAVPAMPEAEESSQESQLSDAPLGLLEPDDGITEKAKEPVAEKVSMVAKETVHAARETPKRDVKSSMAGGALSVATGSVASRGGHGIPTNVSAESKAPGAMRPNVHSSINHIAGL